MDEGEQAKRQCDELQKRCMDLEDTVDALEQRLHAATTRHEDLQDHLVRESRMRSGGIAQSLAQANKCEPALCQRPGTPERG